MKTLNATQAKNQFGDLLEQSGSEPVAIQKNGKNLRVIMSMEEYEKLTAASEINPDVVHSYERSLKRWDKLYEALAK